MYNSSGLLYYAHPDLLGSVRLATTPSRAMYYDTAYAPFGETYASTGTLDPAYTGQMNDTAHRQDVAGGLYDFPVREYSTQGRWPSPDPLGVSSTCPKDPQTQNRYAYVRNNPMSYTDPTGAYPIVAAPIGGGGCDPFDPSCSGGGGFCDPEDPLCFSIPCDPFVQPFCFPPIPVGGGFTNGGAPTEQPRPFRANRGTAELGRADQNTPRRLDRSIPVVPQQLGICPSSFDMPLLGRAPAAIHAVATPAVHARRHAQEAASAVSTVVVLWLWLLMVRLGLRFRPRP